MANILPIEKDKIPYLFDIVLSGKSYTFGINYNSYSNMLSADLFYNNLPLVLGERIVYKQPLFEAISHDSNGNKDARFFDELIVPYDFSNEQDTVTYDNFYITVFLWIMKRS